MEKIHLNLAEIYYTEKPPKNKMGEVSNLVAESPGSFTVKELAERLGSGCPITMGYFPSKIRSSIYWAGQQYFSLDFDNGQTIEESIAQCKKLGLEWTFIYPTASYTPEIPKHRVVFITPEAVTDIRQFKYIILALLELFPMADQSCKDPARLNLGGNFGYIPNGEDWENVRLDVEVLMNQLNVHFNKMDATTKRDCLNSFCQQVGINILDALPSVKVVDGEMQDLESAKNSHPTANSIFNYRTGGQMRKKCMLFDFYQNTDKLLSPFKQLNAQVK